MPLMGSIVVLEWSFSPSGFLEEPIEITREDYTMTIGEGKAEARISSEIYDARPPLRQDLHDDLNDRLMAAQLVSHKPYELSRSAMTRVHPDGRRDIFLEGETAQLTLLRGTADFQVIDKDGYVVSDSRRERIEKKTTLAERISACRKKDDLLESLLRSYNSAVDDPDNELVHLYEIRDALDKKLGHKRVQRALGIESTLWSRFETLCNDGSLRQGRHRGKSLGVLRDATKAELTEAREIALELIEAYLTRLENAGSHPD